MLENGVEKFEDLVSTGGEVALRGLYQLVSKAAWLVFLFEEKNKLAGVAGLKRPRAVVQGKGLYTSGLPRKSG
jgi:hypothetical protein